MATQAVLVANIIVKTKKGYEVRSEAGKRLGGPYKTKEEARKRLRQVEHFKKKKPVKNETGQVLETFTTNLVRTSKIRYEMLEGRRHIVAPCVMLTEGVHHGSNGPGFYPKEENSKAVRSWNHKPIVVYHPEIDGVGCSACDPHVLNTQKVGVILRTKHDNKLRTECWFDEERTREVDKRVIDALVKGEKMEVSTGLFLTMDEVSGKWNDEDYDWVARDHQPDHLAILPDKEGACSIKDGAGLNVNNQQLPAKPELHRLAFYFGRTVQEVQKMLPDDKSLKPFTRFIKRVDNKRLSHQQTHMRLARALSERLSTDTSTWNGWIEDIFDDEVIFWANGKLFKMGYRATDSEIGFQGEPEEVARVYSYETVNNEVTMDKKKIIADLIANGHYEESDRSWLEGLQDAQLEKVSKVLKKTEGPPAKLLSQDDVDKVTNEVVALKNKKVSMEDLDPQTRRVVNRGLKAYEREVNGLVERIMANENNVYTKEELAGKEPDELRKILALAGNKAGADDDDDTDYSGRRAGQDGVTGNTKQLPTLVPPTTNWQKK